jgi:hypothetical protein
MLKVLAAAMAFTAFSAPAYASVVYAFTFNNLANGGGTVDGTVTLPSSADGVYAASSLVVTSNTAGFGLGQYVGKPDANAFTISGGNIIVTNDGSFNISFEYLGDMNSLPDVVCCSLLFDGISGTIHGGLSNASDGAGSGSADTATFTLIPLPTALPLFATGLGGLGLLGWRRKRKAQAV